RGAAGQGGGGKVGVASLRIEEPDEVVGVGVLRADETDACHVRALQSRRERISPALPAIDCMSSDYIPSTQFRTCRAAPTSPPICSCRTAHASVDPVELKGKRLNINSALPFGGAHEPAQY